jgi:hypothetical protein
MPGVARVHTNEYIGVEKSKVEEKQVRRVMAILAVSALLVALVVFAAGANTTLSSEAVLTQSNDGNQVAVNDADQDQDADQFQYQPGGAGGDATLIEVNTDCHPAHLCNGGGGGDIVMDATIN